MSKDDSGSGTAAGAAGSVGWNLPMSGKTGTTEAHRSSGFVGFTNAFAAANYIYDDSTTPSDLCSFPLRQCGSGDLFGGNEPARTWFTAMKVDHPRQRDAAPDGPALRRRGAGLAGAEHLRNDPGPGASAAEGGRLPGRRAGHPGQQQLAGRRGGRHLAGGADGAGIDHHHPGQQRHPAGAPAATARNAAAPAIPTHPHRKSE